MVRLNNIEASFARCPKGLNFLKKYTKYEHCWFASIF